MVVSLLIALSGYGSSSIHSRPFSFGFYSSGQMNSDSKLTDLPVLLRKLLRLYSVRKSIAIIRKRATIMDFLGKR